MNKNAIVGLVFVVAAVVLTCVCASSEGGAAFGIFGKAIWYAPYAALVLGVRQLTRLRG